MLKSLPRLEDVPRYGSVAKSVCDGRGVIFVLSGDPHAMSLALVRDEGRVQKLVYYTSKALRGAE